MRVTNDKRREVAAKVRETMGALGQVELDGIPLADLIEPEECDECSTPNRFEELTAEVHDAYENLADSLDGCIMPEGYEWPDSWERLEDDARQLDIDLNDTTDDYPRMSCCRDLVRRAKALAEVSE